MFTVYAGIGETPPDHKGYDLKSDEISVVAESYEAGSEILKHQIPEGWRLLHWRALPID